MGNACAADWKLILEYLKVLLSWPVVVGFGATIGTAWFRTELRALINRIASFEFPGGKLVTQQAKIEEESAASDAVPPVPAGDVAPPVLDGLRLSAAEQATLKGVFDAERAAARMWEYRYLNYFFAPTTQHVLNWLISLGQATTFDAYEAFWTNRIAQAGERQAVIHALQMHLCIQVDGPAITVSDKGREYAAWPERKILGFEVRVPA
ncbi:hypothetical protein R75471_05529 [Paraburkholderia domus]|uniref:hypothetical protein n=1 Tax=Paraburkholderia domus TaxID=2793075 RepID=UPI001B2867AD|nr:hypothetical protein [Paraburkholderia domus]CAE6944202.1 hypothetical protein R75471_05529 [Paraburkholderia domus]